MGCRSVRIQWMSRQIGRLINERTCRDDEIHKVATNIKSL